MSNCLFSLFCASWAFKSVSSDSGSCDNLDLNMMLLMESQVGFLGQQSAWPYVAPLNTDYKYQAKSTPQKWQHPQSWRGRSKEQKQCMETGACLVFMIIRELDHFYSSMCFLLQQWLSDDSTLAMPTFPFQDYWLL